MLIEGQKSFNMRNDILIGQQFSHSKFTGDNGSQAEATMKEARKR